MVVENISINVNYMSIDVDKVISNFWKECSNVCLETILSTTTHVFICVSVVGVFIFHSDLVGY